MRILSWLTRANFMAIFGNQENAEIAAQLRELMSAAVHCSIKLDRKFELRESDMVEDEHRGDAALGRIEDALERAFLVRFGKADPTRLAHELDDIIDGMRDVARHVETYQAFLKDFPESSWDLIEIVKKGIDNLDKMISEVLNGRVNRSLVSQLASEISDLERQADVIRARAEQELASQPTIGDFRSFFAQKGLNDLLEGITDHAKHCTVNVLAIARQEA